MAEFVAQEWTSHMLCRHGLWKYGVNLPTHEHMYWTIGKLQQKCTFYYFFICSTLKDFSYSAKHPSLCTKLSVNFTKYYVLNFCPLLNKTIFCQILMNICTGLEWKRILSYNFGKFYYIKLDLGYFTQKNREIDSYRGAGM